MPSHPPGGVPEFGPRETPNPPATAFGPLPGSVASKPNAGWAVDNNGDASPVVTDGAVRIMGDSRAYLINDYTAGDGAYPSWSDHTYARIDLKVTSFPPSPSSFSATHLSSSHLTSHL